MADPIYFLVLAIAGIFSGLFAGLLGVGGGFMLVPVLVFFLTITGTPELHVVHASIGTSMGVIVLTSLSSAHAHLKTDTVQKHVVFGMVPGLLIGALIGSKLALLLPTRELAFVFSCFVLFSAYQIVFNKKPKPTRVLPNQVGLASVGSVVGILSAILGAGGGFISVPFMIWCNVPMRQAVSTSAVMGFPIAVFSCAGYVFNGWQLQDMPNGFIGYVYWPAILAIGSMSVLFAPIGAKLAHTLPVHKVKTIFALLLVVIALTMIYKAFSGF